MKNNLNTFNTFNMAALFFSAAILASGCIERELPVGPRAPGLTETSEVDIGADYAQRIYFDLPSASVVDSHDKLAWDLAFSSSAEIPTVRLNSARFSALASTGLSTISAALTDEEFSALAWQYDAEEGAHVATAASPGGTLILGELMVIKLGYDLDNTLMGSVRLMIDSVTSSAYHFRYAPYDQPELVETAAVPFDAERHWLHFSFTAAASVALEPPADQWQLLFTQYTALLDGTTSYLVTGVLTPNPAVQVCDLGRLSSEAALDAVLDANWDSLQWSQQWNAIGYDWKTYDFDLASYTVDAERHYAIRLPDDREFVLRFVDFYSPTGDRGYVTFTSVER
jgi:hypothetical protein